MVMEVVERKTAELEGADLDWAVAIAEGWTPDRPKDGQLKKQWPGGVTQYIVVGENADMCATWHRYKPSSDWSQGGPLVAQNGKRIGLELRLAEVSASFLQSGMRIGYTASDVLIAACRAIVAAKLGDTVQIPSELA